MDLPAWDKIYTDLPSKQVKVAVRNKSLISCTEDETRTLSPEGLQGALDAAMAAAPLGRCFVRPSGTEDVVRVYAEAETQAHADALAAAAIDAIETYVNK
jgi:phosphoacetylglucosamine mutase